MNPEVASISGQNSELHIPQDLAEGLEMYWKRWGSKSFSTALHLPNFQDPHWSYQHTPSGRIVRGERFEYSEVKGDVIDVPYVQIAHEKNDVSAVRDLIYNAQVVGYGVVIDVGCADTLTPLTVAASYDRTIVIAIDPYTGPHKKYPDKCWDDFGYNWEYPYLAKWLSEQKIRDSAAFYFRLDVGHQDVQNVLANAAWRVQIVAPNPEANNGKEVFDVIESAANMVAPGGEMIVTGDAIIMGTWNIESKFIPNSYVSDTREGREIRDRLTRLQNAFTSYHAYRLEGSDLFRRFGIGDSGYFRTIGPVVEGKREMRDGLHLPPGIAVFGGKK